MIRFRIFALTLVLAAPPLLAQTTPQSAPAPAPATDTNPLPPQEIGTIAVGQGRGGLLEAGDWTMSDGTWADIWYAQIAAGQRVTVDCRSRGFSCYLQLLDPWGNKLSEDAGGGGGGGARLNFTAREAGRYQIVVNNYSDLPQPGSYLLTVR